MVAKAHVGSILMEVVHTRHVEVVVPNFPPGTSLAVHSLSVQGGHVVEMAVALKDIPIHHLVGCEDRRDAEEALGCMPEAGSLSNRVAGEEHFLPFESRAPPHQGHAGSSASPSFLVEV